MGKNKEKKVIEEKEKEVIKPKKKKMTTAEKNRLIMKVAAWLMVLIMIFGVLVTIFGPMILK